MSDWVHCSTVANGIFTAGKRVSVNKLTKEMLLVNTKFQSDGSKLQKIESFSRTGVNSGFFLDGVRVGDISERLNLTHDDQDWLLLRPSGKNYNDGWYFGEFNENNERHGRGICIYPDGGISIGYWDDGYGGPGNNLTIMPSGNVEVGERCMKDGYLRARGTCYKKNGDTEKFGD